MGQGLEPWYSDGTAAGTVSLGDLFPGPGPSTPVAWTDAGAYALFAAYDGTTGYELWRTDGTAAGTALLADIFPGPASSFPQDPVVVAPGIVLFVAGDGVRGRELWLTDGTAAGTVPWTEVWPGRESAWPRDLTVMNGAVYFSADDGTGRELFRLGEPAVPESCGNTLDDDGDGDADCADVDCAADATCALADPDGDGAVNSADCAPGDPGAFAVPAEVQDVTLSRDGATGEVVLAWPDVVASAGSDTLVDVMSSPLLPSSPSWSCLGSRLRSELRDGRPGSSMYLVRASNACGPPAGSGWGGSIDGTPASLSCP